MAAVIVSLLISFTLFAADLNVEVSNLKSGQGVVAAALFLEGKGRFPESGSIQANKTNVEGAKTVTLEFKNLEPGTYAIAAYHDENENSKLDTGFLGIPSEGFGFSNDPRIYFGPPSFSRAKFKIPKSQQEDGPMKQTIRLKHY